MPNFILKYVLLKNKNSFASLKESLEGSIIELILKSWLWQSLEALFYLM